MQKQFAQFAQVYCYECHGPQNAEAELDLRTILESPKGFAAHTEALELVYDAVDFEDMPPSKYKQPSDDERSAAIDQILGMKELLEQQSLNDPGLVVMPRLTRSEYDRVIRDITGKPISVSHILPDEGGAGEGFSNVGEAHSVSIMQIEKYLDASKLVLEHLVATPDGWYWSERPLKDAKTPEETVENMKLAIRRIYSEIENRVQDGHRDAIRRAVREKLAASSDDGEVPKDKQEFAKRSDDIHYLEATWRYLHRQELGFSADDLETLAKAVHPELRADVLGKFLKVLGQAEDEDAPGLLKDRVAALQALPGPSEVESREALQEDILNIYQLWTRPPRWPGHHWTQNHFPDYEVSNQRVQDMQEDLKALRWPFRIKLEDKEKFEELYLVVTQAADGSEGDLVHWRDGSFELEDGSKVPWDKALRDGEPVTGPVEALTIDGKPVLAAKSPTVIRLPIPENAAFFEVTAAIPDEARETSTVQVIIRPTQPDEKDLFYYDKRHPLGHWKESPVIEKWYGVMGDSQEFWRERNNHLLKEDHTVYQGLDKETLDALGMNGVEGKVKEENEKAKKNPYFFSVAELRELASPEQLASLKQLETLITGMARRMTAEEEPSAEELRGIAAKQIEQFMDMAWRRYVTDGEVEEMLALFDETMGKEGTSYEESLKLAVTGVMMSPYFIYRYPVTTPENTAGQDVVALTSHELASRLSFALWASIPDQQLLDLAKADKLRNPDVLLAQARRMLQDPRAAAMSEEFSAQWFRFANFDQFSEPDSQLFPEFTPDIAKAMYQEMRHFFLDLIQNNRPITNVLQADYTFANEKLAEFYGMDANVEGAEFRRVKVDTDHRGGVIGMGAILTRNAAAQRTSPVKRGVWVFEEVLGGHIPNPPADVPPLSDGERNEEGMTVVEQLAVHRDNPACYSCHAKFDPLGIALENFDPIGRWREKDSAGEPVANSDTMPDGKTLTGFQDLRSYLVGRQDEFVNHFCRKLLGYMLGRGVELGDRPLMEDMKTSLKENDYRFQAALEVILQSPQYLNRRVQANLEASTDSTENNPNS